uniref:Uncharacterized protein n=1 Tax=Eutreptiella gymnastica TaxID=73025 RepID=A0A7S1NUP6_9EUGL|mmetsp:Transcript_97055/g.167380  ORF Transcript_97055/g.167380 Transcript_97055/m.167380 type:complete len:195 (+) Transcript_97055:89-673(+)
MTEYFLAAAKCDPCGDAAEIVAATKAPVKIQRGLTACKDDEEWNPHNARLEEGRQTARDRMEAELAELRRQEEEEEQRTAAVAEQQRQDAARQEQRFKRLEQFHKANAGRPEPNPPPPEPTMHPIDEIHKHVRESLIELQAELSAQDPHPHMRDLEAFVETEKDAYRCGVQEDQELEGEAAIQRMKLRASTRFV